MDRRKKIRMPFGRLAVGTDAKTKRGEAEGVLTGIQYLSPHTVGELGFTLCPWSTPGCRRGCLYNSGYARIFPSVNQSRRRKTWEAFGESTGITSPAPGYVRELTTDALTLTAVAERYGMAPAVRLNGTSDVPWWQCVDLSGLVAQGLNVYDYTKAPRALTREAPAWWHLTYSVTERPMSWVEARRYMDDGAGAAVVFTPSKFTEAVGVGEWRGYPVVDGTTHDVRFRDPPGVVVALKALPGPARTDSTGWVIR